MAMMKKIGGKVRLVNPDLVKYRRAVRDGDTKTQEELLRNNEQLAKDIAKGTVGKKS